jgi:signal transduction histidine kinase
MMAIKEALTNAISHANPSRILIAARFMAQQITIEIRDNGRGFEPSSDLFKNGHFGILGMQERLNLLSGTLRVESDPAHGTIVRMVVPREQKAMERTVVGSASGRA